LPQAVALAQVTEPIKGYGHVKQRALVPALARWDALMAQWLAD